MENQKELKNHPKKEKMDSSGLTKKERRALKVKEKSQQNVDDNKNKDSKPENINKPTETTKSSPNVPAPAVSAPPQKNQLTEKQLRKLEWEKKLAEQKQQQQQGEKQELSKAELRQKRREQQEAQRLAKAGVKPTPVAPSTKTAESADKTKVIAKKVETTNKVSPTKVIKKIKKPVESGKVQLVNHLYTESMKKTEFDDIIVNYKNVHPSFVKLGVQYSKKSILGSNARCLALLQAVKFLVNDLQAPQKHDFSRYLESVLQSCVAYLQHCRPFAVSMTNALRYFKGKLRESTKLADNEKRSFLSGCIETYINDEIDKAGEAISLKVQEKILNGDTILTYGCSSLIRRILLEAHKTNKNFHVIVVDGRPFLEGRQMVQRLVNAGISCSYIEINALGNFMNQATKVLLGAHALLTNGYVMSRIGTAQVALMAKAYNKPVLVTCETYKFSERVQTDSFVYNELGDINMLSTVDTLEESSNLVVSRKSPNLNILNLLYDVTPPDLVTAVVTELAILPCTSVPVVLRIKPTEFV